VKLKTVINQRSEDPRTRVNKSFNNKDMKLPEIQAKPKKVDDSYFNSIPNNSSLNNVINELQRAAKNKEKQELKEFLLNQIREKKGKIMLITYRKKKTRTT